MDYNAAMNEAVGLHRGGRFAEAAARYRAVLDAHGEDPDALHLLGLVTHRLGDSAAAVELVDRALARRPDDFGFLVSRANLLLALGRSDAAEAAFRGVLAVAPHDVREMVPVFDNLAVLLLKRGRLDLAVEAEALARRSLAQDPQGAEAHNNLGSALIQRREFAAAIVELAAAVRLRPDYREALYNLAVARTGANDLAGADAAIRAALKLAPDSVPNLLAASVITHELSLSDEALEFAQRAHAIDPDAPEVNVALAQAWRDQNEFDEAAQLLTEVAVKTNEAAHWTMLSHLHWEMGRLEDAKQDVARALALDPDRHVARAVLANSGRCKSLDDDNVKTLIVAAEKPDLSDDDRMMVLFALGKSFDDVGEYARSFEYYRRANLIKKARNRPYMREGENRYELESRATYTKELIARLRPHGSSSETPVFVVGLPRSGTSLTEQIIASHPDAFGAGELIKMREVTARIGTLSASRGGPEYVPAVSYLQPDDIPRLARVYLDHMQSRAGEPKARIVDKMPLNLRHIGLISVLFPKAHIVHCTRNPVDNCLSMYFQNFGRGNLFANDLDDLGYFYAICARLMRAWREVLPGVEIFEFPYESVVADPETWARKLIAHIGLPWDDRCLSFHETDRAVRTASAWQVKQPIYKRSVARWKRYGEAIEPLLARLRREGVPFEDGE